MGWETRKMSGDGPPEGAHPADEHIREDVQNRLADDPGIDATDVEVQVANTRVVLTGTVPNELTRQMVEVVAFEAEGVTGVDNNLVIRAYRKKGAPHAPRAHEHEAPIEPETNNYLGAAVSPQGSSLDPPNDPGDRPGVGLGGMPADTSGSPLESGVDLASRGRRKQKGD